MTGAGVAYEVDTRLRPSGQQGMLVTSFEGFERYQTREAADLGAPRAAARARRRGRARRRRRAAARACTRACCRHAKPPWPELAPLRRASMTSARAATTAHRAEDRRRRPHGRGLPGGRRPARARRAALPRAAERAARCCAPAPAARGSSALLDDYQHAAPRRGARALAGGPRRRRARPGDRAESRPSWWSPGSRAERCASASTRRAGASAPPTTRSRKAGSLGRARRRSRTSSPPSDDADARRWAHAETFAVKLVACPDCHAQYDVSTLAGRALHLPLRQDAREPPAAGAVDAEIARCAVCGAQVQERRGELHLLRRGDRARARRALADLPRVLRAQRRGGALLRAPAASPSARAAAGAGRELRLPRLRDAACRRAASPTSRVDECPALPRPLGAGRALRALVHRAAELRRAAPRHGRQPRVQRGNPSAQAGRATAAAPSARPSCSAATSGALRA